MLYIECHGTDVLAIRLLMGQVNPTTAINVGSSLLLLISCIYNMIHVMGNVTIVSDYESK